ncbi:MAG: LysM peptidoglycan-binding domain-containing M23 family metallopeptidase [Hydrotalea sp.]|nr:LysM peptidoglycan-binding domain-containing M23 family metallopeptidase [Hydrotalea sp.]
MSIVIGKNTIAKKYLLLLPIMLSLWGCESLPFRWGEEVGVKDLVVKGGGGSKPQKLILAGDNPASLKPTNNGLSNPTNNVAINNANNNTASAPQMVTKKTPYKVVKGDTIYSLARQNNMTPAEFAKDNGLKITDQLKIGQNITISKKVASNAAGNAIGNSDGMTPPRAQMAVTETPIASSNATTNDKANSSGQPQALAWPLQQSNILQKFGEGTSQDGLILAGSMGQNVAAVSGGTVIYVGTDIKPLGLLVLVKHDNGLVSTYGYLQKSLVKKGDAVKRGQIIATVGRSGLAQRPQLYFEIRKNNQPSNPLNFLPARASN